MTMKLHLSQPVRLIRRLNPDSGFSDTGPGWFLANKLDQQHLTTLLQNHIYNPPSQLLMRTIIPIISFESANKPPVWLLYI